MTIVAVSMFCTAVYCFISKQFQLAAMFAAVATVFMFMG